MIDRGKRRIAGVDIDAVDYEGAIARIIDAARERRSCAVSALAIHGVMTGVLDAQHRSRLNQLDLVTPDGQGVRWALNVLHSTGLDDRVYGPRLMLLVSEACAREGIPVFLYGSSENVLARLAANLTEAVPGLDIVGTEPSKFRTTTEDEQASIARRIRDTGAGVVFVGLGCPRQEIFAYEYRELLSMPCLAVGAAFDYHAGLTREPPAWVQRAGMHGYYRLLQEPRRLWKRFVLLPPLFVSLVALQKMGVDVVRDAARRPPMVRPG